MMIASLVALSMAAADCRQIGRNTHVRYAPAVARPGDRLKISFEYRDGPAGFKPVPLRCVDKMRVHGRAALERNYVVRITNDAPAGAPVRVVALIGGVEQSAEIIVTGRDQQVLTGKWHPVSAQGCRGRALGEMVFGQDGGFSFTFRNEMIETRTSGGGRYDWDAASGRLTLNGRAGLARFVDGQLMVDGFDFDPQDLPVPPPGTVPAPPPICRIVLRGG